MKRHALIKDVIRLTNSKKTWEKKAGSLLKGIIFLPFLYLDLRKTNKGHYAATSASASGDDVYPLF